MGGWAERLYYLPSAVESVSSSVQRSRLSASSCSLVGVNRSLLRRCRSRITSPSRATADRFPVATGRNGSRPTRFRPPTWRRRRPSSSPTCRRNPGPSNSSSRAATGNSFRGVGARQREGSGAHMEYRLRRLQHLPFASRKGRRAPRCRQHLRGHSRTSGHREGEARPDRVLSVILSREDAEGSSAMPVERQALSLSKNGGLRARRSTRSAIGVRRHVRALQARGPASA